MQEVINPEILNTLYLILAIGVGWILLRFIFKLARKAFSIGCFAIVFIGIVLVAMQFIQGA